MARCLPGRGPYDVFEGALVIFSVVLALLSGYSAALMLYAWEDEEKLSRNSVPETYEPPRHMFTLLLPARHEEAVIQDTIQRVVDLNYPPDLVQVLIVIEAGDHGTIGKVNEKLAQLRALGPRDVQLITFDDPPINKPHGLNVGLKVSTGDVVTIFDAEDEPHPDILNVVNTPVVLGAQRAGVLLLVQVQNALPRRRRDGAARGEHRVPAA